MVYRHVWKQAGWIAWIENNDHKSWAFEVYGYEVELRK